MNINVFDRMTSEGNVIKESFSTYLEISLYIFPFGGNNTISRVPKVIKTRLVLWHCFVTGIL